MIRSTKSHGFALLEVVFIVVVVVIMVFIGYTVYNANTNKQSSNTSPQTNQPDQTAGQVTWQFDGQKWEAMGGTPPSCSSLKVASPADVSLATAVLYPGQTRGEYKPHGGFIFRGKNNDDITVKIPLDAQLTEASRYIEQGETQYYFLFTTPCGLAYRFDHLLVLTPKFQAVADSLPAAKVDDSRATRVNPPVTVTTGETVATSVGFKKTKNVSFDFGVYDLRQTNKASKSASWAAAHTNDIQFGSYGLCWIDMLPEADATIVRGLPGGDQTAGTTSDYCE